jgi:hypothetical protein
MKCKDFEGMIHELVSRRVAGTTKQLEALDHAGHCLWCARRLDEEHKLTERLQAFADSLQGQRAPLRVETELLQAFRERNPREGAPLLGLAWRRLRRGLSWGLAFAAIVATAWIVLIQWPRDHRGPSTGASRIATGQPQVASDVARAGVSPGSSERSTSLKGNAKTQAAYIRNAQRPAPEESASETTTDFISLGTCDDSQCMEEATLVRVALPSEALLAFGLAVDSEYAPDALVQADVALGSNGVPFAIRFVN